MQSVDPETRVSFATLNLVLLGDLAKMRHMFSLSFYVLCTTLLVLLLCVHRVSFLTADAPLFFQRQAESVFLAPEFEQIGSVSDFYPWLRSAMMSAARSSTSDHMRVLDLVAVRQIRMYAMPCADLGRHLDAVDPLSQAAMFDEGCLVDPQTDDSGLPESFGVNQTFRKVRASALKGFVHLAKFHDFANSNLEFLAILQLADFYRVAVAEANFSAAPGAPSNGTVSPATTTTTTAPSSTFATSPTPLPIAPSGTRYRDPVDDLDENGFIDKFTSAVAVDTLISFPQHSLLVVVTFIMEVTTTGMFTVEARSDAFRFFVSNKGIIFVDVLVFLCFLGLVFFLSVDLHERYSTQIPPANPSARDRIVRVVKSIGVWEFFTFALVISILTVTGMRLRLWDVSGRQVDSVQGIGAFNLCVDSHDQYKRIYELYCVSLVLVAFRLFYTFRYIAGLSKMTNTMRSSAADLGRVAVLWMVLLVVFTIAACMIFGRDVYGVRTFWQALVYLMTVLVSAQLDEDDYRVMYQSQGTIADVFLICLFVIFWLLLLNLVIAIISSSFLATESGITEPTSITTLVDTYVVFTNPMYAVDRIAHERHEHLEGMSPTQRAASRGVQMLLPFPKRLRVLYGLRMWRLRSYLSLLALAATDSAGANRSISYAEVIETVKPHDVYIANSQIASSALVTQLFCRVQSMQGGILFSVTESTNAFAKVLDVLAGINTKFDDLAREVRRYRNINSIQGDDAASPFGGGGGGGRGSGTGGQASGGCGGASLPSSGRRRTRGMSVLELESGGADALKKERTFSIHDDGDVAELDSGGDSDDSDHSVVEQLHPLPLGDLVAPAPRPAPQPSAVGPTAVASAAAASSVSAPPTSSSTAVRTVVATAAAVAPPAETPTASPTMTDKVDAAFPVSRRSPPPGLGVGGVQLDAEGGGNGSTVSSPLRRNARSMRGVSFKLDPRVTTFDARSPPQAEVPTTELFSSDDDSGGNKAGAGTHSADEPLLVAPPRLPPPTGLSQKNERGAERDAHIVILVIIVVAGHSSDGPQPPDRRFVAASRLEELTRVSGEEESVERS